MDKATLIQALIDTDGKRARSIQTAIGVSSLGDCRRKVWHMARGDEKSNPTLSLPAIMGTAIHATIEASILNAFADRAPENMPMIEKRVEIEGLPPATIDFFDPMLGEVVDWKTIKLSNVNYFISKQKRWQVQTYAYILTQAGYEVKTVSLVGIPRDGTEDDIIIHSEPYDETVALAALGWLEDVTSMIEPPAPEREPLTFCAKYCPFFGELCSGIPKDLSGDPIMDDAATDAARRYKELAVELKELEKEKDALKATLEGHAGITLDGIKVRWSEIAGRQTPDLPEIEKLLGGSSPIPMKTGSPSLRLEVR